MFERLSDRLNRTFKKLKGQGKLTEKNIQDALKEVRIALLEADVHYRIVKGFIEKIKGRAIGKEVLDSLTPTQQVIKIVNEELIRLMGGEREDLRLMGRPPFKVMLVGLQGSGKTTTAGKLALFLRKRGRNPMLVPADVYRPAAIEQLKKLADNISIPIYLPGDGMKPEDICEKAISMTSHFGSDTVIIDTAGRLHIDQELMEELVRIKQRIDPTEILLIADAMTGQDAVNVAREFFLLLSALSHQRRAIVIGAKEMFIMLPVIILASVSTNHAISIIAMPVGNSTRSIPAHMLLARQLPSVAV